MSDKVDTGEMPLDEAMKKAAEYSDKSNNIPSVSRTLLAEINRLRAQLAAKDEQLKAMYGFTDWCLVLNFNQSEGDLRDQIIKIRKRAREIIQQYEAPDKE